VIKLARLERTVVNWHIHANSPRFRSRLRTFSLTTCIILRDGRMVKELVDLALPQHEFRQWTESRVRWIPFISFPSCCRTSHVYHARVPFTSYFRVQSLFAFGVSLPSPRVCSYSAWWCIAINADIGKDQLRICSLLRGILPCFSCFFLGYRQRSL
jgi:hypothetical protein